ncbi:4-hydroxythreonine-4-phosphate dehydrogenase PdxA [Saccharibacter sp. 17.LH.SD]|uniref:4-hydroxythreonine-4-phosphate dehydrogenase PdxA n=1 Tax=Saccharibacter sp. 17.LH.SD TaxID=2689393 RepID=UPI00136850CA|nr:4-hydroxythreonine-4-phosphate dehydrogenase PdxA [Saccharibacter sp. 17.LH.SD]MXV43543.1 4-hydroxythreonine-4-phosphate dehydrogenase PdxA [Saccharibacter sp. 17.LH.SD]
MSRPLALTMGDPAGIGPELTVKAWKRLRHQGTPFFWIGDASLVEGALPLQKISSVEEVPALFPSVLPIMHVPCAEPVTPGQPDSRNAGAVIKSIERAVSLTQRGEAGGVVTNPIAKHVLAAAGFPHPGHTEFLAELCGVTGQEVMMLACPELKVVLTSIHVSLRRAIDQLSEERIIEVTTLAHRALQRDFGSKKPRLAIAGLNPHAGENGMMGEEERTIIKPAVAKLQDAGFHVTGPMPPDTMFSAAARPHYDAAICLYHDQGLIPLKTLDMAGGVNVTLGLPIIRTSPDHGTAFDIACGVSQEGRADASSLVAALAMAEEMSRQRTEWDRKGERYDPPRA